MVMAYIGAKSGVATRAGVPHAALGPSDLSDARGRRRLRVEL